MEQQITISYNWSDEEGEFNEDHKEQLQDEAITRIAKMIKGGYVAGELNTYLYDGENEIHYTGYWEFKRVTL